jgi:hypothetical protein
MITDRQLSILNAIVEDYVDFCFISFLIVAGLTFKLCRSISVLEPTGCPKST